jgi:transcriptional regulator with XRE-family HTH domain
MRRTPRKGGRGVISQKRLQYNREELMTKVIEQLEAERKKKGLYQRELAHRIGVSEGMVSRFLTPPRNLTLSTLADMAAALGVEIDVSLRSVESNNHAA